MMKIDYLSAQPDRGGRYRVALSDGNVLKLYRQTVEDFGLYSGMEISQEDLQRLHAAAGKMSARVRAVRIVTASGISSRDLEQRLIQKGESPEDAKEAVIWMTDLDLINDRKTAEHIVSICIQKGYGISRAKQALYEKRISKDLWADALADYPDQQEKILEFLKAKLPESATDKDIRRTVDALLRRGHNYTQIRCALTQLSVDSDDLLEG